MLVLALLAGAFATIAVTLVAPLIVLQRFLRIAFVPGAPSPQPGKRPRPCLRLCEPDELLDICLLDP